jgi:hypothetical protein
MTSVGGLLQLSHERRRRGMPDVSLSVKNLTYYNCRTSDAAEECPTFLCLSKI